ncbi:MAG: preprotein translocase subunit SecE [Planctomycetota bacterium]|jgi:preprotein translocase SecE subunit
MEAYKAGQGSLARLTSWMLILIALFLGCVELYSWIYDKTDKPIVDLEVFRDLPLLGVPLSWKLLFCVALFFGVLWLISRYLLRPQTVDTLIETELELKKVSWPTKDESMNATWVVVLVTVLMTATLSVFDGLLGALFRMIF